MDRARLIRWGCVLALTSVSAASSGCAPKYTKHDALYVTTELDPQLYEWCKRGVTAACIDFHFGQVLARVAAISKHREALSDYCDKGHASACLYASGYMGKPYRERACELGDLRACYDGPRARTSDPSDSVCQQASPGVSGPGEGLVGLERNEIKQVVADAMDALAYCFNRKLAGTPERLHSDLSGEVITKLRVEPSDGSVSEASSVCSTLRDAEIELCVTEVFETLEFTYPDRPGERACVIINYPVSFVTSDSN